MYFSGSFLKVASQPEQQEVNAFALVVGIDFLIRVPGQHRAGRLGLRVGGPEAPGHEGGQARARITALNFFTSLSLRGIAPKTRGIKPSQPQPAQLTDN